MSLRFLLSSSNTPESSGSVTPWTACAKPICWPWIDAEWIDWAVCITDCWLVWITDGVCIGGGIEVCAELCGRACPCWTVTVLPFSISATLVCSSICSMFVSTPFWGYMTSKVETRESFLFRGLYKELEEEKPMRSASRSLEQIRPHKQSIEYFTREIRKSSKNYYALCSWLFGIYKKEKMKLTCYVTSTSPWFLYAASVSLCFFFFFANGSRVTVASPSPNAGWTAPAASYYIMVTSEPCHSLPNKAIDWFWGGQGPCKICNVMTRTGSNIIHGSKIWIKHQQFVK